MEFSIVQLPGRKSQIWVWLAKLDCNRTGKSKCIISNLLYEMEVIK